MSLSTGAEPNGVSSSYVSTGLSEPYALTFDSAGNLYVGNDGVYNGDVNGTITKVTPAGNGSVFAAGFSDPQGLAFDAQGNLYVANTLYSVNSIMKIAPNGSSALFA